jgi:hypothetical protein
MGTVYTNSAHYTEVLCTSVLSLFCPCSFQFDYFVVSSGCAQQVWRGQVWKASSATKAWTRQGKRYRNAPDTVFFCSTQRFACKSRLYFASSDFINENAFLSYVIVWCVQWCRDTCKNFIKSLTTSVRCVKRAHVEDALAYTASLNQQRIRKGSLAHRACILLVKIS